jgi:hypothetical protein
MKNGIVSANVQEVRHSHDGIIQASAPAQSSMPQRGRLDVPSRSVVITARLGATLVLQRVSLNAYKGVAAQLVAQGDDDPVICIVLRHDDPAYSITLNQALPLDEAVAVWRNWSDTLCVPLLLADGTGEDSIVRDMLGATLVRKAQPRRSKMLVGRRPRFSKRRGQR